MDFLLLPFRMIGRADRWANAAYRKAMAMLLTLTLSYLGLLWIGAIWDIRWLSVGAMWLMAIITVITYLQPNVGGFFAIFEAWKKTDDPDKFTTVRAGLMIFISVIAAGGSSLIMGAVGAGLQFPFAILIILLTVSGAVVAGKTQLEIWLPRISKVGIGMLLISTILAIKPVYFERLGIPTLGWKTSESAEEAYNLTEKNYAARDKQIKAAITKEYEAKSNSGTLTPEDRAAMQRQLNAVDEAANLRGQQSLDPINRKDREVRAARDLEKEAAISMLQNCSAPQKVVEKFEGKQAILYKAHCEGAGPKGLTTKEIQEGWPALFQRELIFTNKEDDAHVGKSHRPSYLSMDYWVQKSIQWAGALGVPPWTVMLFVVALIGFHFWLLMKFIIWAWKKAFDKEEPAGTGATPVKKSWWPMIGNIDTKWPTIWVIILGFGYYFLWQPLKESDAGKVVAQAYGTSGTPVTEAYTILQPKGWGAVITNPNQHLREPPLPDEAWRVYAGVDNYNKSSWENIPMGSKDHPLPIQGRVTAGDSGMPGEIDITVDSSMYTKLNGTCTKNPQRTQTCTGYCEVPRLQRYREGKCSFKLDWESTNQAVAKITLGKKSVMEIKFRRQ